MVISFIIGLVEATKGDNSVLKVPYLFFSICLHFVMEVENFS